MNTNTSHVLTRRGGAAHLGSGRGPLARRGSAQSPRVNRSKRGHTLCPRASLLARELEGSGAAPPEGSLGPPKRRVHLRAGPHPAAPSGRLQIAPRPTQPTFTGCLISGASRPFEVPGTELGQTTKVLLHGTMAVNGIGAYTTCQGVVSTGNENGAD